MQMTISLINLLFTCYVFKAKKKLLNICKFKEKNQSNVRIKKKKTSLIINSSLFLTNLNYYWKIINLFH